MSLARRSLRSRPLARRWAVPAAVGLLAVAVVHAVDGANSLTDQVNIAVLELALVTACAPLAVVLLTRPVRVFWHAAGGLCSAALIVYLASRTVGLPGSSEDIGNWGQSLGVLAMLSELAVIALAALVLRSQAGHDSDRRRVTVVRTESNAR